jgi:rubrerythrin
MKRTDFRPNTNSSSGLSNTDRTRINAHRIGNRHDTIQRFVSGQEGKTSNNSLHTDGEKLYSYNTVIATKQKDGTIVVNNTKYSITTSAQQSELVRALRQHNIKFDVTGGKERNYSGEDFSAEVKDEQQAQKDYSKLEEQHPEHARSIEEIKRDEHTHEKKFKALQKYDEKKFHEGTDFEKGDVVYGKGILNNPSSSIHKKMGTITSVNETTLTIRNNKGKEEIYDKKYLTKNKSAHHKETAREKFKRLNQ